MRDTTQAPVEADECDGVASCFFAWAGEQARREALEREQNKEAADGAR